MKHNHNKFGLAALSVFAMTSVLAASPLISMGEKSAIYTNSTVAVKRDSNVTLSADDEIDDISIDVSPGLEFVYGNVESGANFSVVGNYTKRYYMDNDNFDADLLSFGASGVFQTPKSVTRLEAGYVESQGNSRQAVTDDILLETVVTSGKVSTDYKATFKTSVVAGIEYSDTDRKNNIGNDYSQISVPVNAYYAISEKLDLGLGYRYRDSSVDPVAGSTLSVGDRKSNFFNVALRGELTPKLVADLKIGYQVTEVDLEDEDSDDFTGLAFDAQLTYSANEKLSASANFSKDTLVGIFGEIIDNTSYSMTLDYLPNGMISTYATLGFLTDEYEGTSNGREGDYVYFEAGAAYAPLEYMTIQGALVVQDHDSTDDTLDFKANAVTLSVNLRY